MKKELFELFGKSSDLSLENIITRLAVATVIACFIFLSIGNNLAMSLGMVGALSIVRFRTAVKDSRDTVYIFWTIVAGICCGAGDYLTASAGSAFVFVLLLLFGRIRNDNRVLLIIRTARMNEERVEALIFQYFSRKATLRVKNTTETSVEFIYELSRRLLEKKQGTGRTLTDEIYDVGNVEYFNIVMQNDDISS